VRGELIFIRVRDRVLYFYFCLREFIVYRVNRLIDPAEVVLDGNLFLCYCSCHVFTPILFPTGMVIRVMDYDSNMYIYTVLGLRGLEQSESNKYLQYGIGYY
jgi:hypothetical protein